MDAFNSRTREVFKNFSYVCVIILILIFMKTKKIGRVISRLAVVAEGFSTYYIPGKSMIGSSQVNVIEEHETEYRICDAEGTVLSKVDKRLPCLVDYTDLYECVDPEWLNSDEVQQIMVTFGNYLLERYNVQVMSNDGSNVPLYQRQVTDADLRNFEYNLFADPQTLANSNG